MHPSFLSLDEARELAATYGTPLFVYDAARLWEMASSALAFPNAFGLTVRYAMKALPTAAVLRLFHESGLHMDASSGYEAERALRAGIPADRIQITAQELPKNLQELVSKGVLFNACSLNQLRAYGAIFPGAEVSVRINPGLGSGHSNRTNVGGPSSSFGIWHELLPEVRALATEHGLRITGMHTHIGSGSDPETWVHCAGMALEIAERLPEVTRLSLGGGYKIARMPEEKPADMQAIGRAVVPRFEAFAQTHGRKLHLEIEPGTFLVANAGALLSRVMDVVHTGAEGYRFIKADTGMTEILRPSLYGAQHPIALATQDGRVGEVVDYLVVGHCCESGDILTPAPGDPETPKARSLQEAQIGDVLIIDGAGAYCSGMSAKNYNAFPVCAEVLRDGAGNYRVIRERQTLEQMLANEV
ncbi:MAG: diaminopimelate decarboxylase [Candidatus Hydrogenedentes bacterium]|nr:diaminopimelate decarboxylase [Candidatus Hydrogenedentota bacterium]